MLNIELFNSIVAVVMKNNNMSNQKPLLRHVFRYKNVIYPRSSDSIFFHSKTIFSVDPEELDIQIYKNSDSSFTLRANDNDGNMREYKKHSISECLVLLFEHVTT